jgi:hypothetical protein
MGVDMIDNKFELVLGFIKPNYSLRCCLYVA